MRGPSIDGVTDVELAAAFLTIGAEYERARPGFPDEIAAATAPARVGRVLDLGAGTGKFTERLISRADEVVAVDPSEPMLAELRRKLPDVRALIGTAEEIPVPDATIDLVTVAQAYHWFDPEPAAREIRRVLTSAGRLALVWNGPDQRCRWDADAHRIAHPPATGDHVDDGTLPVLDVPGFSQIKTLRVWWMEPITRTDYLRRWLTVSSLLAADEHKRAEMLREIEVVLDTHPETRGELTLRLPHVTDALLYEATT